MQRAIHVQEAQIGLGFDSLWALHHHKVVATTGPVMSENHQAAMVSQRPCVNRKVPWNHGQVAVQGATKSWQ